MKEKVNLLTETEKVLKNHNKTWDDVEFVGVIDSHIEDLPEPKDYYFTVDEAKRMMDVEYDPSYGTAYVDRNLVVVGKGGTWWLDRREYDGSEWWGFNACPVKRDKGNIYPDSSFVYSYKD